MSKALIAAIQHFQAGRLKAAETSCVEALRINSNDAQALHLLGVLKSKTGHVDEAVTFLERALEANPQITEARFNLGIGYRDQEAYEAAVEIFSGLKGIWPDHSKVWTELAFCLAQTGRTGEALLAYEKAAAIDGERRSRLPRMVGSAISA